MRWNCQNSNLKNDFLDYLEGLFGVETFNKKEVIIATGEYLKYTRDVCTRNLKVNLRYELPPSILDREWKVLIGDAKEKKLRKTREQIIGTPK
jgi:hypothetical protein